jgi:hypothetical protein
VDLDALVEDLSKASDSLSAPRASVFVAPLIGTRERRSPRVLAAAAIALAAYFGGVITSGWWEARAVHVAAPPINGAERSDGRPTPASFAGGGMPSRSGATDVIEARPSAAPERAAVTAPLLEDLPVTTLAPIVFAPSPAVTRVPGVTPAVDRAAPRRASPGRRDVRAAMAAVAPRVEACATDADAGRVARVQVTFGSHGRAVHAVVSGVSGPTATCVAAAARRARIAPFARETFAVEYPFAL